MRNWLPVALLATFLSSCQKPPPPAKPTPTPAPAATATPAPSAPPLPVATPSATPSASPSPSATPLPTATPVATPSVTPSATPAPTITIAFEGIWSVRDDNGQEFDIILFPGGKCVSTWVKGPGGAKGESGTWTRQGDGVIAVFDDGWTDAITVKNGAPAHAGFAKGTYPAGPPNNQSPAIKVEGRNAGFTGVWQLDKEPDNSILHITLQSSGRAFSTVNGLSVGKWETTGDGAKITWNDGWVDVIDSTKEGWRRRGWPGSSAMTQPPADESPAARTGETP